MAISKRSKAPAAPKADSSNKTAASPAVAAAPSAETIAVRLAHLRISETLRQEQKPALIRDTRDHISPQDVVQHHRDISQLVLAGLHGGRRSPARPSRGPRGGGRKEQTRQPNASAAIHRVSTSPVPGPATDRIRCACSTGLTPRPHGAA